MDKKKIPIIGSEEIRTSVCYQIAKALKKIVNFFVSPDSEQSTYETTATISPANIDDGPTVRPVEFYDEQSEVKETFWHKKAKHVIPPRPRYMKHRVWHFVIINLDTNKVMYHLTARRIKDAYHDALKQRSIHINLENILHGDRHDASLNISRPICIGLHSPIGDAYEAS